MEPLAALLAGSLVPLSSVDHVQRVFLKTSKEIKCVLDVLRGLTANHLTLCRIKHFMTGTFFVFPYCL